MTQKVLRVGIITADEGAQAIQEIYLPVLTALTSNYEVAVIHNASKKTKQTTTSARNSYSNGHHTYDTAKANGHEGQTNNIPRASSVEEVISDPTIELILNFMPNEYHEVYTVAALNAGKHVMVETPVSLSIQSARRIIDAEKRAPKGAKVFVACARRYAPCIEEVFTKEVASLDRIYYARCRNIAGPSLAHTATAPRKKVWSALTGAMYGFASQKNNKQDDGPQLMDGLLQEMFSGEELTKERIALCKFLASLGCHDLGLMRDTLGFPDAISNISVNEPYYSALFHYYSGRRGEHPFTLMYETGTDAVPRCDAHLAIYGDTKTVSIQYGLPYARDEPVKVVVETADENGEMKRTESVSGCEETYKGELKALHAYLTEDQMAKTTARDGLQDLKLFYQIFEQYDRQCGTIRTPLG
ncbi:Gfo/Idh/MocA family protein [Aspergillus homomorphus CBS 101889]|uniref:NAD binding Rossmann fold oxidoreductase n=1 Tax=Aspergillus homomorphus (strain CBS 101889) TaxID=1450537 RepID=A0A395I807_ASPHC|nr:NAD binding Rossmann fold oxidoreductase [Aspergillus homomorphus CBS 101889]RAL16096.1 NAD binding Rossmann fold oxidoreductase [Aspergillus homomorphus CBS 101889]